MIISLIVLMGIAPIYILYRATGREQRKIALALIMAALPSAIALGQAFCSVNIRAAENALWAQDYAAWAAEYSEWLDNQSEEDDGPGVSPAPMNYRSNRPWLGRYEYDAATRVDLLL